MTFRITQERTFDNAADALANAKKLLAAGEIKQSDFDKLKKKLAMKGHTTDLDKWLDDTYKGRK